MAQTKRRFKKSEINTEITRDGFVLCTVVTDDGEYLKNRYGGFTVAKSKSLFYQEFSREVTIVRC